MCSRVVLTSDFLVSAVRRVADRRRCTRVRHVHPSPLGLCPIGSRYRVGHVEDDTHMHIAPGCITQKRTPTNAAGSHALARPAGSDATSNEYSVSAWGCVGRARARAAEFCLSGSPYQRTFAITVDPAENMLAFLSVQ